MTDDSRRGRARRVNSLLRDMFAHLQGRPTPARLLSVLEQEDDAPAPAADDNGKKAGGASGR